MILLIWLIIRASFRSLFANKMRSLLAMLGIIIGVWAVIVMLAVGAGAQNKVLGQIKSMGTNLLIVSPGQLANSGVRGGQKQNLVVKDADAMRRVEGVALVTPVVSSGNIQVKYLNQNEPTTVTGCAMTYLAIRDFEVEFGRPFTETEADGLARVALLGPTTAQNLFGDDRASALGEQIKVNGINFKVVGVLKSKGSQGWYDPDDQILVPYPTAMRILFGLRYLREVDVEATDGANLNDVQTGLTQLLKRRHRIAADATEDFRVTNQAQMIAQMTSVLGTFTYFLAAVAAVSLIVGGIGIMNIMLVTVTERTREIGVRKAIGAKHWNILLQFLLESLVVSGVGGTLGILLGILTSFIIGKVSPIVPVVHPLSVIVAFVFSGGVGIVFGFYPAWRAAKLDPIEALRYE